MNILGLIDIHPFDGTEAFTCLRIDNNGHIFDLPIDQEQLEIILNNAATKVAVQEEPEETSEEEIPQINHERESFTHSPIKKPATQRYSNDDVLFINESANAKQDMQYENRSEYTMGESLWDDDL